MSADIGVLNVGLMILCFISVVVTHKRRRDDGVTTTIVVLCLMSSLAISFTEINDIANIMSNYKFMQIPILVCLLIFLMVRNICLPEKK